jgi:hypothetical protein
VVGKWRATLFNLSNRNAGSMSTLLVDELFPGVVFDQRLILTRSANISDIRPWIYIHNTLQDGDFQLEVIQGSTTLVTKTINFATINAAKTEDYFHGYIKFEFDSLQLNVAEGNSSEEYILRFQMINHTLDNNNFLGIVRDWENPKYTLIDVALNDSVAPAGIEVYAYRST